MLEKALQMEREIIGHLMVDEPNPQIMEEWKGARDYTDGLVQHLETCVSELQAALKLVRPYALRWHDHMLTFFVEQAVEQERPEDKRVAWELYREYEGKRQGMRETMESALAHAKEVAPTPSL